MYTIYSAPSLSDLRLSNIGIACQTPRTPFGLLLGHLQDPQRHKSVWWRSKCDLSLCTAVLFSSLPRRYLCKCSLCSFFFALLHLSYLWYESCKRWVAESSVTLAYLSPPPKDSSWIGIMAMTPAARAWWSILSTSLTNRWIVTHTNDPCNFLIWFLFSYKSTTTLIAIVSSLLSKYLIFGAHHYFL